MYPDLMNTVLSPIESEFSTPEEAQAYDRWFRVQVEASIADVSQSIPHDQVMAEMRSLLEEKRKLASSKVVTPD